MGMVASLKKAAQMASRKRRVAAAKRLFRKTAKANKGKYKTTVASVRKAKFRKRAIVGGTAGGLGLGIGGGYALGKKKKKRG